MKTVVSQVLTGRWIWITGASSGIGETLARSLVDLGNYVILTARSTTRLESIKSIAPDRVWVLPGDISDPDCAENFREGLLAITPKLDTVILNAGTCEYLDADAIEVDLVDRVNSVNYLGFVRSVYAALPRLYESDNQPQLIGISSASVLFGLPRAEAYGASKAAMTHFLECLRVDIFRRGVSVSIVYPGFVDTPLTRQNDFPMPWIMPDQEAADRILRGIARRKAVIAFPWPLIASLKFLAMLPVSWSIRLAQKMTRTADQT